MTEIQTDSGPARTADQENDNENGHFDQSEQSQLVVNYRPGIKKNYLDIKNDKENGHHIKLDRKSFPGIADRRHTAFIRFFFDRAFGPFTE